VRDLAPSIHRAVANTAALVLPDLTNADNVSLLVRWEGSWAYLTTLSWVRISESGDVQPATFPPTRN
jgi:hypothetical protein